MRALIAAGAALALVVMSAGGAIAAEEATEAPAETADVAESMAGPFPMGTFVTAEWGDHFAEFDEDGGCRWRWPKDRRLMECTYTVEGDLFTEASYVWESPKQYPPATYRWAFDGEHLTFELVGDDPAASRVARYQEQPYRYVPDPRLVVVAAYDVEAGAELLAGHTELRVRPGAEIPADTLTDRDVATGATTTAAISTGQPITPDMLEPAE